MQIAVNRHQPGQIGLYLIVQRIGLKRSSRKRNKRQRAKQDFRHGNRLTRCPRSVKLWCPWLGPNGHVSEQTILSGTRLL